MNQQVFSQVQEIFRDVFDRPELAIQAETNSGHIEEWDSLAHMSLVTAIERQFKIKFALGELQALRNVGEMVTLIEKKVK